MAAPEGNQNARKGADWRQALKRALARHGNGTYHDGLEKLAAKYVKAAEKGEAWALKDIGDRFDGRPAQSVDLSGEVNIPLSGTVKFVGTDD